MNPTQIRRTYRWMAPVYDALFRRFYREMRTDSIARLALEPSQSVLLVGVGTGLDIPLLPPVTRVIAVDLSPKMLKRAAGAPPSSPVHYLLADGGALPLRDASVSAVILHLVLSVAPDPRALLREATRVLQPGGRIAVLDHFVPPGRLSTGRRLLAHMPVLLGTHLDRRFETLRKGLPLRVVRDERRGRGLYRMLILERVTGGAERGPAGASAAGERASACCA